jgi:uncharacterized damage-inducible protein DinB
MNRVSIWFERTFEFTYPAELYPNLCARLRGTPARLEEILRRSSRDALVTKTPENWSAQEHAGHLGDLEPLWMTRVDDYLKGRSELTVADVLNRKTHDAHHNARALDDIMVGFRKGRAVLTERVEQLEAELLARTLLHPRLKQPMRLVDHLYFVAEHDDHHLARIWELINVGELRVR